jgi:hypothetical protein
MNQSFMLPSDMGMVCPKASLESGKPLLCQVACVTVVDRYHRTRALEYALCCGSGNYLKGQLSV